LLLQINEAIVSLLDLLFLDNLDRLIDNLNLRGHKFTTRIKRLLNNQVVLSPVYNVSIKDLFACLLYRG
jgi:hypothetical protein